jgi:hypothetical protein
MIKGALFFLRDLFSSFFKDSANIVTTSTLAKHILMKGIQKIASAIILNGLLGSLVKAELSHVSGTFFGLIGGYQNSYGKIQESFPIEYRNIDIGGPFALFLNTSFKGQIPDTSLSSEHAFWGLTLGHEQIFSSGIMAGIEVLGNFSYGNKGTENASGSYKEYLDQPGPIFEQTVTSSCRVQPLGNLEATARLGYTWGRWMPFIKIGGGISRYQVTVALSDRSIPDNGDPDLYSANAISGSAKGYINSFVIGCGLDIMATSHFIIGLAASLYLSSKNTFPISATSYNASMTAPIVFSATQVFTMLTLKYKIPSYNKNQ